MSQGNRIPHADAMAIAERLVATLEPACERIAIAGSLRRAKPMVGDIEIVCVPRWENVPIPGLLETTWHSVDRLEELIREMLERRAIEARQVENHRADGTVDYQTKLGPAFKALVAAGMPVDLFIVRPPASWGVIFGLRTGPGDWNTRLVTDCKAIGRRVAGGQVEAWDGATSSWVAVPTPEEEDFFRAIGQSWVEPRDRHPDRVRIQRAVAEGATA